MGAVSFELIGGATEGSDDRQVSSLQDALRIPLVHGLQLSSGGETDFSLRQAAGQAVFEIIEGKGGIVVIFEAGQHGSMDGDDAALFPNGRMEGGNIGEADEHLRMFCNHLVIQLVQKPGGTVAAPEADDGFDAVVLEEIIQVLRPFFVAACQETVIIGYGRGQFHLVSQLLQKLDGPVVVRHAPVGGGRQDTDSIPLVESHHLFPGFFRLPAVPAEEEMKGSHHHKHHQHRQDVELVFFKPSIESVHVKDFPMN